MRQFLDFVSDVIIEDNGIPLKIDEDVTDSVDVDCEMISEWNHRFSGFIDEAATSGDVNHIAVADEIEAFLEDVICCPWDELSDPLRASIKNFEDVCEGLGMNIQYPRE